MGNALPELHAGHAPISLQEAFREAVYAFEEWEGELAEPIVVFGGRIVPISQVFEAMRNCNDILPMNIADAIKTWLTKPWKGDGPLDQMNFSTASRVMGVLVRRKLLFGEMSGMSVLATKGTSRNHRP
ncbi:hypothetical protein [Rhizobium sp. 42MFCr.1]|jgi:hypothetical protein|uniref:hypothetical protein n=1 Tax=Rhizobium sp. 42MFCr.1 TaxID=1048680 RepID=UPI00035E5211|nr:hypothetical protein [Rhizobium sp. 42MFCr.1]